jgi:hypothetical protein
MTTPVRAPALALREGGSARPTFAGLATSPAAVDRCVRGRQ